VLSVQLGTETSIIAGESAPQCSRLSGDDHALMLSSSQGHGNSQAVSHRDLQPPMFDCRPFCTLRSPHASDVLEQVPVLRGCWRQPTAQQPGAGSTQ
jgi:hypothetical protein